jgi:hypothetical protein
MPVRTRAQRQKALDELHAEMPESGWPAGEEHRRFTTLSAGGDPDSLVCVVCGKPVKHEDAHIVLGVIDADHAFERFLQGLDFDRKTLPPCAFCPKHNGEDEKVLPRSLSRMPAAARNLMAKLES